MKQLVAPFSRWVAPFVMFHEAYNIILPSCLDEFNVMRELLCRRFRHQDVNTTLKCVK